MDYKILVADDEQTITRAIAYGLKREGFVVETAADGEEALRKTESFRPHVLVMDVMMPRLTGFEVCRKLEDRKNLGILLLTVKNDIVDKIVGLEMGADDYMTKPFDLRELIARVRALCRRLDKTGNGEESAVLTIGELSLHPEQRLVSLRGTALNLTPKEFDLLALLLSNLKRAFSREELLDLVWGMEYAGGTRTVDIHVQRLRTKLGEPYQHVLQTVYGIGYKAIGEVPCG
ncbi:DNA-binding response regulator [Paenibacillus chitinolyticus]|uniref:DNA-binding response regulator n=1 Tax=Paenibacillus chitinolyticus TaxID=79263 RepID=A0A410WZS7_9BACL|nr:response regulator transcription factor [Paenibacillus chitinolyticus]MCY9590129.1 response regulator transcription factor [Paenibacillus chitinolyticus]MCY9596825.1 response regulator transcription factor [Paenibacillus chitinolyticus]QAV19860.1 DNA-binding response regulator [Paenibacillus chitinolyticus]